MIDDPFSRFDDVPITEEEVNRIKKTVGSLYRIKADTSVIGDHPKPLVAYFQGEPVYKGDLVVLLEYQEQEDIIDLELTDKEIINSLVKQNDKLMKIIENDFYCNLPRRASNCWHTPTKWIQTRNRRPR